MNNFIYNSSSGVTYQYGLNNTRADNHYHGVRHSHPQVEFYLLLKGNVSYTINGVKTIVKPNELLILNAFEYHIVEAETDFPYERMVLQLPSELIPSINNINPLNGIINTTNYLSVIPEQYVTKSKIKEYLLNIQNLCLSDIAYKDHRILSNAIQLVVEISSTIDEMKNNNINASYSQYAYPQITSCIHYINNNLSKPISIDDVIANLGISKSRMQHLFKEIMGYSISEYIIKQKMLTAHYLLMWGNSPTEVAQSLGYEYYSTFFNAYKKFYGFTPMDVVKQYKIDIASKDHHA